MFVQEENVTLRAVEMFVLEEGVCGVFAWNTSSSKYWDGDIIDQRG